MTSAHSFAAGGRGIAAVELLVRLILKTFMDSQTARSLTILIPTFDRPHEVNGRLREIEALWGSDVIVHVQVNPGKHSAAEIDRSLFSGPLTVRENTSNIGVVGNIVAGIQGITTEWVWILGDDDILVPEARARIEEAMRLCDESASNAAVFNHWFQSPHAEPVICRDLKSFTEATGFGDALFISGTIWRTCHFRRYLQDVVEYSYCWSSQVLPHVISVTEGNASVLVSNDRLINCRAVHRWSRHEFLERLPVFLEHPAVRSNRGEMLAFMWPAIGWSLGEALGQVRRGEVAVGELVRVYFKYLRNLVRYRPSLLFARNGILALPLKWLLGRGR